MDIPPIAQGSSSLGIGRPLPKGVGRRKKPVPGLSPPSGRRKPGSFNIGESYFAGRWCRSCSVLTGLARLRNRWGGPFFVDAAAAVPQAPWRISAFCVFGTGRGCGGGETLDLSAVFRSPHVSAALSDQHGYGTVPSLRSKAEESVVWIPRACNDVPNGTGLDRSGGRFTVLPIRLRRREFLEVTLWIDHPSSAVVLCRRILESFLCHSSNFALSSIWR